MVNSVDAKVADDVKCPGCHFECRLARYQCGRGLEFFEMAVAGEEVPIRRGPMMTPSERAACGGDGKPPLNDRVMHGFNILANRLQKRHVEAGARKVVSTLSRTGQFMSLPFLAKRMLMDIDETDEALDEARRAGYIVIETDFHAGRIARLTDAGREQAAAWKQERDDSTAVFLLPLSDEEKETLETLVRKLLVMG